MREREPAKPTAPWIDRAAPALAACVWAIPLIVISAGIWRRPGTRSLDPLYRSALAAWENRESMYTGSGGFNYLPTFVPLYWPFAALPLPTGEIMWRLLAAGCMAHALWQLMRLQSRPSNARGFLLLSIASLPISLGALQMGQANIWIAASLFQAAAAIGRQRWWVAAVWLAVALAIKPIALAPIGLALLLTTRLWLPVAASVGIMALVPFAFGSPSYVWSQYVDSWGNLLGSCAQVSEHRFTDINGLLRTFGTELSGNVSLLVRALFGATVAAWLLLHGRRRAADGRWFQWLALSACYVLLCNPMSEANSYCMLGIPAAILAWQLLGEGESRNVARPRLHLIGGWAIIAVLLFMGGASEVLRPWLGNSLDLFVYPCCAIVMITVVALRMAAARERGCLGDIDPAAHLT